MTKKFSDYGYPHPESVRLPKGYREKISRLTTLSGINKHKILQNGVVKFVDEQLAEHEAA